MQIPGVSEQGKQIIEYGLHSLLRHVAAHYCQCLSSGVPDDSVWTLDGGNNTRYEAIYRHMQTG
jgi:hypothetical protein